MTESHSRPLYVVLYYKGPATQSVTDLVTADFVAAAYAYKASSRRKRLSTYMAAVYPDGHVDLKLMNDPGGIGFYPDGRYCEVKRTPIEDMRKAARANAPTDQPEWGPLAAPDEEIRIGTEGAATHLTPRTDSER